MSNSQMFNAGEAKGTGQAKTDQFVNSAKDTATMVQEKGSEAATTAQQKASQAATTAQQKTSEAANTAQQKTSQATQATTDAAQGKKEEPGFMQQTGEQMKNMAQGAVDTVKNTLGVGEQKK